MCSKPPNLKMDIEMIPHDKLATKICNKYLSQLLTRLNTVTGFTSLVPL